ncbi:MAG: hypothetical protein JO271_03545 [Verrucomicrobia bacterium]|nr:hypothetical protein [Verrucomicrobiota bacterium]
MKRQRPVRRMTRDIHGTNCAESGASKEGKGKFSVTSASAIVGFWEGEWVRTLPKLDKAPAQPRALGTGHSLVETGQVQSYGSGVPKHSATSWTGSAASQRSTIGCKSAPEAG